MRTVVTVSLKAIYDKFGEQLENGKIIKSVDGESEYYDLQINDVIACMDGESCKVVGSGDFGYELLNTNGEVDTKFILTKEEYSVGVFSL